MKFNLNRQKTKLILLTLLLLCVFAVGYVVVSRLLDRNSPPAEDPGGIGVASVEWDGKTYYENRDLDVWLIMGLDKTQETGISYGGLNNQQNDFNMLFILNERTNSYSILPINRDTMVSVTRLDVNGNAYGVITEQFALAHTEGDGGMASCKNAADAVSGLLCGITVDHYVALTMDAISEINDAVGGVTLTLEEDLSSLDPAWVEGAEVTLQGEQALSFVRARKSVSDGTNLARMNRQRQYILVLQEAIKAKVTNDDGFAGSLFNRISDRMIIDTGLSRVSDLANSLKTSTFAGLASIEGEARLNEETDHTEFYPDEDLLKKTVVDLFCENR